jgi:cell wall-associated NlpC family hydrolase
MSGLRVININGVSPVRAEPSDRSEMVNQILLGESAKVLEMQDRWIHIAAELDGYEGWINKNEVRFLKPDQFEEWNRIPKTRWPNTSLKAESKKRIYQIPVAGLIAKNEQDQLVVGEDVIEISAGHFSPIQRDTYLETALSFLGTPYLWGGRTDVGIDCSGFIQTVFLLHGMLLPRDASMQHNLGHIKGSDLDMAQPGDLLYFSNDGNAITHVGFYMGNGTVLHGSSFVRLENISYKDRFENSFPYNKRLSERLSAIQDTNQVISSL